MSNAPATTATPNNPFVGKTLGERYHIDRLIGRGGMGLVHLAKESKHGREVVIKMLAPHWADDKNAIARFEREGLRLAQLTHPNIVELFDIGHEDGQSYIVMEFIRGEPLRRFLARHERLTLEEFIPIAEQILAAVGYAHSRQMMLRDIKPSNIMLAEHAGKGNFVKMLDFGLAKLVDGDDVEITKAHVIGTAGYLAPEQIKGETCDVRVDVYALGILFFVMLAGTSPILGENDGAVLYNHVHGVPRTFESVLGEDHYLPASLIALIQRCMEKDPKKRPRNASEAADELRKCVPASMFELPAATQASRDAIEKYWESKFNPVEDDEEKPTSAEWTRPHLRKLLESGGRDPAAARSSSRPSGAEAAASRESGPPQPPKKAKQKTQLGLPSVAEESEPAQERRPKPAKTKARARMDAPTQMMESKGRPVDGSSRKPPPPPLPGGSRPTMSHPALPPLRPRMPAAAPTARPMPKSMQPKADAPVFKPVEHKPPVTRMPPVSLAAPQLVPVPPPAPPPHATLKQPVHEPRVDPALLSQSLQVATPLIAAAAHSSPIGIDEPAPRRPTVAIAIVSVILATALGGMLAYVIFGDTKATTTDSTVADASAAEAPAKTAEKKDQPAKPATEAKPNPAPEADSLAEADIGKLPISGPEGAVLYVDGEKVGPLPTDAALAPGKHTLSVEAEGYLPWEQEVDVQAGDNPALAAELELAGRGKGVRKPVKPIGRGKTTVASSSSSTSTTPTKPEPKTNATPQPFDNPGKPANTTPSKPAPSGSDDVFIKPGTKGKTKDDGIFLPVGKGQ